MLKSIPIVREYLHIILMKIALALPTIIQCRQVEVSEARIIVGIKDRLQPQIQLVDKAQGKATIILMIRIINQEASS